MYVARTGCPHMGASLSSYHCPPVGVWSRSTPLECKRRARCSICEMYLKETGALCVTISKMKPVSHKIFMAPPDRDMSDDESAVSLIDKTTRKAKIELFATLITSIIMLFAVAAMLGFLFGPIIQKSVQLAVCDRPELEQVGRKLIVTERLILL